MFRIFSSRLLPALFIATAIVSIAAAQAPSLRTNSSLRFAPKDAAYYVSLMRMGEQWDRVADSPAVRSLLKEFTGRETISLDQILQMLQEDEEFSAQVRSAREWLSDPENAELIELAKDLFAQEVFVYASEETNQWLKIHREFGQRTLAEMERNVKEGKEDFEEVDQLKVLPWKSIEKADLPHMMIGFRLQRPERAAAALKRFEPLVRFALASQPKLAEVAQNLAWVTIGEREFLSTSFTLDTLLDAAEMPEGEDQQRLRDVLKEKMITLSIGVHGDYLLLSGGADHEPLKSLEEGPCILDHPKLASLREADTAPVTTVTYLSDEAAESTQSAKDQWISVVRLFRSMAPVMAIGMPMAKRFQTDCDELIADIQRHVPDPSGRFGFTVMTPDGYRGRLEQRAPSPYYDGAEPLTLLEHVGGSPLLASVGRVKGRLKTYQLVTKWLSRAAGYVSAYGPVPNEKAPSLISRFDTAMADKILPALGDGESALVVDGQLKSHQWHMLAPTVKEMPLLEPAMVWTVRDGQLLTEGLGELRNVINETMEIFAPEGQAPPHLPHPVRQNLDEGTLFFHPLPRELGFDRQLEPSLALTPTLAVAAVSTNHAKRLLAGEPPRAAALAKRYQQPLARVFYMDFAGIIDCISPWVLEGASVLAAQQRQANLDALEEDALEEDLLEEDLLEEDLLEEDALDEDALEEALEKDALGEVQPAEVDPEEMRRRLVLALNVLSCFREMSSVSYEEGGAYVTESEYRFQDVQP